MKCTMESNNGCALPFKLRKQLEVNVEKNFDWRAPNSLKDSNVSPKQKITEEQGIGARSLARSTLKG
jgi:hypothetical protein